MNGDIIHLKRRGGEEPQLSDEALARACAVGDAGAIAALFDRYHRPVARYLGRLAGHGPDLEDLLQTTFLEVARGAAVYEAGRGNVRTWLYGIATNVVRHHRRATSRRLRLLSAVGREGPAASDDPSSVAFARMQLARAEQALAELGHHLREAFVLCELEGLSAGEAATVLGASEAAIWKRVSKARKAIRLALGGGRP